MDIDTLIAMAQPSGGKGRHTWSRDDDTVIVGMYLLTGRSPSQPKKVKEHLAELIGCPATSVHMRFGNVDAYLGDGSLDQWARQTQDVCDELKTLSPAELKATVEGAYKRLEEKRDLRSAPGG
jgi:hypothetical protein